MGEGFPLETDLKWICSIRKNALVYPETAKSLTWWVSAAQFCSCQAWSQEWGTRSHCPRWVRLPPAFCGTGHRSFLRVTWTYSPLKFHAVALDNGLWFYESWRCLVAFFAPDTLEFCGKLGNILQLATVSLIVLTHKVRVTLFKPNWRHFYELSTFKCCWL